MNVYLNTRGTSIDYTWLKINNVENAEPKLFNSIGSVCNFNRKSFALAVINEKLQCSFIHFPSFRKDNSKRPISYTLVLEFDKSINEIESRKLFGLIIDYFDKYLLKENENEKSFLENYFNEILDSNTVDKLLSDKSSSLDLDTINIFGKIMFKEDELIEIYNENPYFDEERNIKKGYCYKNDKKALSIFFSSIKSMLEGKVNNGLLAFCNKLDEEGIEELCPDNTFVILNKDTEEEVGIRIPQKKTEKQMNPIKKKTNNQIKSLIVLAILLILSLVMNIICLVKLQTQNQQLIVMNQQIANLEMELVKTNQKMTEKANLTQITQIENQITKLKTEIKTEVKNQIQPIIQKQKEKTTE